MRARIGYVGNDSNSLKALHDKLRDKYEILLFETGTDFLIWSSSPENKVDVITYSDSQDVLSGISLLRKLKSSHKVNVPFIIISGKVDFATKRTLIQEGVSDLLNLNFEKEGLIKKINYWIENPVIKEEVESTPKPASVPNYKMPFVKRTFDIVFASLALIFLTPLFLIIAILIRLESRGPVFYSSKRVGTGYKIFDFYKFRSMSNDADIKLKDMTHLNQYKKEPVQEVAQSSLCEECLKKNISCQSILYLDGDAVCEKFYFASQDQKKAGTFIKINNDPRVTRIGKFIRNTSIDELPQLFNVLKGDMSIVGNRPLPLYEAEKITTDKFVSRFLAPAGITGLWQVTKRGGSGKMSEEERMELDNDYARDYSFGRDITIILKTIPALIQKENV